MKLHQKVTGHNYLKKSVSNSDNSFFNLPQINQFEQGVENEDQLTADLRLLLKRLIEKTGTAGGVLTYMHSNTKIALNVGANSPKLHLQHNEQLMLLVGKPLMRANSYVYPIHNGELLGTITLACEPDSWHAMNEDLVQAYAQIAAQSIEMKNTRANLSSYAASLEQKKSELEKIQQYNQNLLSITAHDLSSPLSAVTGYLEMIHEYLEDEKNSKKIQDYYKRIQSGVNDVSEMLGQLDEVIKHKKGFLTLDTVKVDAKWLVREVCDVLTANAQNKGVDLQVSIPDQPVFIEVDIVKFKRVIYNLVSNAIKYTSKSRHVRVVLTSKNGKLMLCVKDEGVGIAEEKLDTIFEPFVKVDGGSREDNCFSKGLGLYISSYFVDLMHGDIQVRSKTGEGTIFTVCLPLVASHSSQLNLV